MNASLLWKYAWHNKIASLVIVYFIISVGLNLLTGIDIGIPCLITLITGQHCFGCGLTRALLSLLKLDIVTAYNYNPLIFIVLPALIFYLVHDFLKFKKKMVDEDNADLCQ